MTEALVLNPGGDLRSHAVTSAVSSALRGLTTVFGMGTGVTPAVWPPGNSRSSKLEAGKLQTEARALQLNKAGEPQVLPSRTFDLSFRTE